MPLQDVDEKEALGYAASGCQAELGVTMPTALPRPQ